jgi:hypothetical protein
VRRLGVLAAFAATVAVAAACGSDSATSPDTPTTPIGDYSLSSVNAKALPFTMFSDTGYKFDLTAGTLSLSSDGKYKTITTMVETVAGHASTYVDSVLGTWVQVGTSGTLTFTSAYDSTKQNATWAGKQLTFQLVDGSTTTTLVYGRK